IFEADLEPCAYGYRPKRSAQDAIRKVHELLCAGYTDVVDADLSKYFDTIPHRELMQSVARRIVDRDVLRLIKAWLKAPVEERDEKGTRQVRTRLDLTLNEAKTKLKEARQESCDFLGYTFGPQHYRKTGREYLVASPSKKSLARLRQKVNGVLASDNPETWPEERDRLNRILRGWSNYFSYGTRWAAYGAVNHHVAVRVRHFLKRRQKVSTRGTRILTDRVLFGPLGVLRLRPAPAAARP